MSAQNEAAVDQLLRTRLSEHGVTPLEPPPAVSPAKLELGRLLFHEKLLSGNRDTACATCHHASLASGDGLALPLGTGGAGLGHQRVGDPERPRVPRNAPEVFARGSSVWEVFMWDGRMSGRPQSGFFSPAGSQLPAGLESILALQAMFPVTSRDEMRGLPTDVDLNNELGLIADTNFTGIWNGLMTRLRGVPEYHTRFAQAYPGGSLNTLGFEAAANAIGAFEAVAFRADDTPLDRYLAGDSSALALGAKRGGLLFFGAARCGQCHDGPLFTDQTFHNLAVPQLGPGKGIAAPEDWGRFTETGNPSQRFAFRTPPLRNVALTGPWMHNGAFLDLEQTVRHHLDPLSSLASYDPSGLPADLRDLVRNDPATQTALAMTLDPLVATPTRLDANQVRDLIAFLRALSSPSTADLEDWIPATVPSGLPVDRVQPIMVTTCVFRDDNANGCFDQGESPLEGVGVEVCALDGEVVTTGLTDEQGLVSFPFTIMTGLEVRVPLNQPDLDGLCATTAARSAQAAFPARASVNGAASTLDLAAEVAAGRFPTRIDFGFAPGPIDVNTPFARQSTGLSYNRRTGVFTEVVRLTNQSDRVFNGPLFLKLTNLPGGVTLINANGASQGAPVRDLGVDHLGPGEFAEVVLQFRRTQPHNIVYRAWVINGM